MRWLVWAVFLPARVLRVLFALLLWVGVAALVLVAVGALRW